MNDSTASPLKIQLDERDCIQEQVKCFIDTSNEFYLLSRQETDSHLRNKLFGRAVYDLHQADKLYRKLKEIQFDLEASADPKTVVNTKLKQKIYCQEDLPYPHIWQKQRREVVKMGCVLLVTLLLNFTIESLIRGSVLGNEWRYVVGGLLTVLGFTYYSNVRLIQFFLQSSLNKIRPKRYLSTSQPN